MFFLFTVLSLSIAQRINIWSSSLTSNLDGWFEYSPFSLNGKIVSDSVNCPSGSFCYELSMMHQELYRYDSTIGYHSISINYSMKTKNLSAAHSCEVYYCIACENTTAEEEYKPLQSTQTIDAITYNLPLPYQADDEESLGIVFWANFENGSNSYCWINDVHLSGIPTTTAVTDDANISMVLIIFPSIIGLLCFGLCVCIIVQYNKTKKNKGGIGYIMLSKIYVG